MTDRTTALPLCPAYPFDPTVGAYTTALGRYAHPLEYAGWERENLSWKHGAALFTGLNGVMPVCRITGPDAVRLLSRATISSYDTFRVGRLKHTVMCDDDGRILTHGLVVRTGEDDFLTYALAPWLMFAAARSGADVAFEDRSDTEFTFQCTGPRTLEILESATGECLHDIGFLDHRTSTVDGRPVRLLRVGMAGTLGYEVHGDVADGPHVHRRIVEAGADHDLQKIGWRSYAGQLCEGGFPQDTFTILTASREDPGFLDFLHTLGADTTRWPGNPVFAGSAGPDPRKRYRTPLEVGWRRSLSLRHEFRGRAALDAELAAPRRTVVSLEWDTDDLLDVQRRLLTPGGGPGPAPALPIDDVFVGGDGGTRHVQHDVESAGRVVGASNGRVYSLFSRDVSSIGVVDVGYAGIGTELDVVWGDPDGPRRVVRARVGPYPHLRLPSNSTLDVRSIPCRFGSG